MADFISNKNELVRLGWIDSLGRTLDWKYWNKLPKKSYFVMEEIEEAEWRAIQEDKEKKKRERELYLKQSSRNHSSGLLG